MLSSYENLVNNQVSKYIQKKQWKDMCLILFSYNNHPKYKLILASNRDEFYNRPTRQLEFWVDSPNILAGQDEQDNGTWLGVASNGRISGITNFRSSKALKNKAPSRGLLVSNYLNGIQSPKEYLENIMKYGQDYNGFNLLAGDVDSMYYYSNMGGTVQKVEPGIYGLSNAFLDTPWPKVTKGKAELEKIISEGDNLHLERIFSLLSDKAVPSEKELPETGVGLEWERILGPIFIESEIYGTRTSTIITIDHNSNINVVEKTFTKTGADSFESEIVSRKI